MTPWPKINRLLLHRLHVKSESDWAKSVVCIVSTRSYTQSAKVDLHLWPRDPKIKRGSSPHHPQHVKFGSDWAKQLVCILPTRSYSQSAKVDLGLWPPWPKINRVPPLVSHNLHVKSESDWAKTIVCIVSTTSYTQSAKDDLDLWPHDPKSIGFLLSSSTTYMWSLKVIGLKR